MAPYKRPTNVPLPLAEPPCSAAQGQHFADGIRHFEQGAYWQAHEAWENAWKQMGNTPEDDAEIVLRGLIQLAAACHCAITGRDTPAARNLAKAQAKLALYPRLFWGLTIPDILSQSLTAPLNHIQLRQLK